MLCPNWGFRRELWATGWMQQNVRMVCAQFLTDVLRISWVEGAKWFAETLVDADPAINGAVPSPNLAWCLRSQGRLRGLR